MDPSAGVPKGAAELRVRSVEKHRELEASPAVAVEVVLTHGVEELGSDAYSLPLRHYYKSRRPVSLGREQRRDCKMTYGLAVDDADKVFCGHRERKV